MVLGDRAAIIPRVQWRLRRRFYFQLVQFDGRVEFKVEKYQQTSRSRDRFGLICCADCREFMSRGRRGNAKMGFDRCQQIESTTHRQASTSRIYRFDIEDGKDDKS
ncbi:PREDICTED: uncharacterized protein LOC106747564 [Dinoponera quadriceps]|uniref:Uncharacterized protein LOC106747564 n=1 Tax=Dinoponera quadriceps TaxID=609295 RepID=A0A6P3XQN3_DINQU|nr:PREDICTED: uncharacterized protein LOC106747564 [Dinoponera quadriceps]